MGVMQLYCYVLLCVVVQAEFNYRDALNLECRLTEDEIMMRDQVTSYCEDQLMPRVVMANRNEREYAHRYVPNPNSAPQHAIVIVPV